MSQVRHVGVHLVSHVLQVSWLHRVGQVTHVTCLHWVGHVQVIWHVF